MTSITRLAEVPGTPKRPQLSAILLGSNPTVDSRWTQTTGRTADISDVGYLADGDWSTSCNLDRTGAGTLAIFARANGGIPDIAGFMICTGEPIPYEEVDEWGLPVLDGASEPVIGWYVPGVIHGWSSSIRIPGLVVQHLGWPATRAPFGTQAVRQFRNGEQLTPDLLAVILGALPEVLVRSMVLEYIDVTGVAPDWA
jgi:hypothetical protein